MNGNEFILAQTQDNEGEDVLAKLSFNGFDNSLNLSGFDVINFSGINVTGTGGTGWPSSSGSGSGSGS